MDSEVLFWGLQGSLLDGPQIFGMVGNPPQIHCAEAGLFSKPSKKNKTKETKNKPKETRHITHKQTQETQKNKKQKPEHSNWICETTREEKKHRNTKTTKGRPTK